MLAAAGALAVALAGASAASVTLDRSSPHGRPVPVVGARPPDTAAARLLDKIAYAAGRQPAQSVGDNQYEYVKSLEHFATYVTDNGKTTMFMPKPDVRQFWQSVSNLCQDSLILEDGSYQRVSNKYPRQKCPDPGSLAGGDPTYRLMKSLPTSPRALLQLLYAANQALVNEVKLPPGQSYYSDGQSTYSYAFDNIGNMLNDSIAPPQFSAALYRAVALIPGVTVVPGAVNAAGQHGVAVAFAYNGQREEWIFDKTTLQFIGERDIDTKTGAVTGSNAIIVRAFVDRPGELPRGRG
jgi:hypothetical protein